VILNVKNLSRPEHEPKTPLAARLREVRRQNGDPDRTKFAAILNVSKNTIAFYERGERTPDAKVLAAYNSCFNVDLNWLITGETNQASRPQGLDNDRLYSISNNMNTIATVVGRQILALMKDRMKEISNEKFLQLLTFGIEQTLKRVDDLTDSEEIESTFPHIRLLLRKKCKIEDLLLPL